MRGEEGREYSLRVEASDGKVAEAIIANPLRLTYSFIALISFVIASRYGFTIFLLPIIGLAANEQ